MNMKFQAVDVPLSALILVLVSQHSIYANTTVILRRTSEEIIIGADSFRRTGSLVSQVCKIGQVGKVFYVTAGVGIEDKDGKDISDLTIRKVLKEDGNIEHKAAELGNQLLPYLNRIQNLRPNPKGHNRLTEIILFGFEDGLPIVGRVDFVVNFDYSNRTFTISSLPTILPDVIISVGDTSAIDHLLKDESFWSKGSAVAIDTAIILQAKANPEQVGGPVDILRVKNSGAEWIRKKPECPSIQ